MSPLSKNIAIWLIILFSGLALLSTINLSGKKPEKIDLATLVERIENGAVDSIKIDGDKLIAKNNGDDLAIVYKENGQPLLDILTSYGLTSEKIKAVKIEVASRSSSYWMSILLPSLGSILFLGILLFILFRQISGANSKALSFGQSAARELNSDRKDKVAFKDVAGAKEAKEELEEVVEFFKHPKKFAALGAKIPKGVLLVGPPGSGKTLLARAVAGEGNVPFFHISGSEFVEMFVGVGAARVRDLFAKAKKSAPCILFIDEIDAVGRARGVGLGGNHDEREQTLNQILTEMDGFEPNNGVIVLAATNRPDVLDSALLRPGRFDRRVILELPDITDREAILKIHVAGKPLAEEVNIRRIAEQTPGFSGAELMNLVNEAAILAARRNHKTIAMDELRSAALKVMLGPERKSYLLNERERKITAYHEAGHALVAHYLEHADPIHKVSIVSRGMAAGYTLKLPVEDVRMYSRAKFRDDLAVMLGGYVAELETFGDITTGASSDLKQATDLARRMVMDFGMSEALGARTFGSREEHTSARLMIRDTSDISPKVAEEIDREISRLIAEARSRAEEIVKTRQTEREKLVAELLEKETVEKESFEALFPDGPKKAGVGIDV